MVKILKPMDHSDRAQRRNSIDRTSSETFSAYLPTIPIHLFYFFSKRLCCTNMRKQKPLYFWRISPSDSSGSLEKLPISTNATGGAFNLAKPPKIVSSLSSTRFESRWTSERKTTVCSGLDSTCAMLVADSANDSPPKKSM